MGIDSSLPVAMAKSGEVPVWNGAHKIVGYNDGFNVTCELRRPNGVWYKHSIEDQGRVYVSAALTNLDLPDGWVWGECPSNNGDRPGPLLRDLPKPVVRTVGVAAAAAAALAAAQVIIRRRRPQPPK